MNELAYSFHLGNDKNKSKKSKEKIKNKEVKDKIYNNNAIQNANQLSRANKHNLRKYDNKQELIETIYGSDDLYKDVKQLYLSEFEDARIKYNEKQKRNDRKINDYFKHISDSDKSDLACEIIIELGDMYFWKDKDLEFKKKMTDVFKEQIVDFNKIVPDFKIANATVHYDETSPHLHIVGIAVKNGNKNGMEKQVGKSTIFTKELLREIQDTMRIYCINSFNKYYKSDKKLKRKLEGRNDDYQTRYMQNNYDYIQKEYDKQRERLDNLNKKTEKTLNKSKEIKELISNLKPTKITKDNYIINTEQIKVINEYIDKVDENIVDIKNTDDLTSIIENFEEYLNNNSDKIQELEDTINNKDKEITSLEKQVVNKQDKIAEKDIKITELNTKIETLDNQILDLNELIDFLRKLWKKLLKFIQTKLFSYKKEDIIYEQFLEDLYKEEILNDEDIKYIEDYSPILDNKEDELNDDYEIS